MIQLASEVEKQLPEAVQIVRAFMKTIKEEKHA